jgi:hypothetical protein
MSLLDPESFLFELPLYTEVKISDKNEFINLMKTKSGIHHYNPFIKEQTTFVINTNPKSSVSVYPTMLESYIGVSEFQLQCVRTGETFYFYINVFTRETTENEFFIEKIGQHPSIADFHISQIKIYNNVLSKKQSKEFTKAIGLAANGVGIGSFVYLRRIFESLIEEAHQIAIKEDGWNEKDFDKARIGEKIDMLKYLLPEFLVENKSLYSILSKGIHELEENECLEYFEAIRVGIELILDEKLEAYNKQKKILQAKLTLEGIQQKLKK